MPTDEPHVAPATAEVAVAAGGNLAVIRYSWSHPKDGEQDGLLVVGPAEDPGGVTALWGDSWHQSPAARAFGGVVERDVISMSAVYGGDWEWKITIDPTDPETLRVRMDNVVPATAAPEGVPLEYWAMDTELRRER